MRQFYLRYCLSGLCAIWSSMAIAQGTWTALNHDTPGAVRQSAIRLDNGMIITGSEYYFARVYDPVGDSIIEYRAHGGMESAVVKLNNGLVLHSGGFSSAGKHFDTISTVSLFDPMTNELTRAVATHPAKGAHTATAMDDGRALLTGGSREVGVIAIINDPYISDTVWFSGRRPEIFKVYNSCHIFDPVDSSVILTTPMHEARVRHRAVKLPGGKIIVVGGRDKDSRLLKSCEIFDPVLETWSYTDSLPLGLSRFRIVSLLNGDLLLSGGFGRDGASDLCLRYQVATGSWHKMADMNIKRFNHTMTRLNSGKVLVTGGASDRPLKSTEIYDPVANTWTRTADMTEIREDHEAVLLNSGEVLVVGGVNNKTEVRRLEKFQE